VTCAQSLPLRNEPQDELLEEAAAMAEESAGAGLDYYRLVDCYLVDCWREDLTTEANQTKSIRRKKSGKMQQ
jgi:hypothetical protein